VAEQQPERQSRQGPGFFSRWNDRRARPSSRNQDRGRLSVGDGDMRMEAAAAGGPSQFFGERAGTAEQAIEADGVEHHRRPRERLYPWREFACESQERVSGRYRYGSRQRWMAAAIDEERRRRHVKTRVKSGKHDRQQPEETIE
jgi:hypothetical protein